ncbi:hypothetical protein H9Q69_005494 [Fusarium xylarioides]|uniref:LysM domain-containing protein n=1 Tax=Fusarium xylarioides TaxID=221167 RepID=A0A9P7HYL4_9HYPO|nr:hypothetical protein H9Q70_002118 [Fusarium xylarioides]KAG5765697.1 hypothetical protein H9Q72_006246 [Fusarium xylarioides]KAG5784654.1 hypothetical protein H9Q73_001718 [Fusarium xylarioides]KAG5795445.1 hypothetical protein H9Q69_005494 [Fusarium xylarioides]
MHLVTLLASGLVLQLPFALATPYRQDVECKYKSKPLPGQTCEIFAEDWSITLTEFKALNPGLKCPKLNPIARYCVEGVAGEDEPSGVDSMTTKPTAADEPSYDEMPDAPSGAESVSIPNTDGEPSAKPTVPEKPSPAGECCGNSIQTPEPIQKGMVANCNKFHYVTPATTCQAVLDYYKISLADFIKWNPAVGEYCTNMWAGTNACVSVKGYTSSSTRDIKPDSVVDNGVATPSPIQAGLVKNCVNFHYIGAGTTCHEVLHHYKVTMAQFAQWNPAVGEDCKTLWKGTYACVAAV